MADNIVGIKFGVAGGKGFQAGSSGALIKEQLEHLASKIKLKVNINRTYFKNQLSALKKDLDNTLGELNINVRANVKPNVHGDGSSNKSKGSNQQVASYESVTKTLEKLYQTKARLLKLSGVEKNSSVNGLLLLRQSNDLQSAYDKQLAKLKELHGADDQRIKYAKDLREELEKAYKNQENLASKPELSNTTALAKLNEKAESLYKDNGFDKIIARSKEAALIADGFYRKVKAALNQNGTTKEEVAKLNTEFLNAQAQIKKIGRETDTAGNKIKEAFDSRVIQRIAQALLLTLLRALRQVYQNVKQIDAAMTELEIITQATPKQLDESAKNMAKSAKEIGATLVDLIKSTSVYARLGFGLADAEVLAKKTTMYAKISSVNIDEATRNITGIIKAYNIGAEEVESVLDQLIWVGNKFAISQGEIGEGMNNAASALESNGNTLQEAIGIVTAANASLQNISKSSTAVRTIAARISASTAELQELGEDAGDILSTADLDAKMQAFGVSITGANGELRSTYSILNDLAKSWEGFNDAERAAIADMLAGTRQQNAFYSIMNNWKDAESVVKNAAQGIGSLQEAQEVYVNSIEGKTNQLKAAWEEFSTNLLDSAIVKFLIDLLSLLAKVLNAIISMGEGFVAKGAMSAVAILGIIAAINKFIPVFQNMRLQFKLLQMELNITATGIKGFFATIGKSLLNFLRQYAPILILTSIITLMTTLSGKAKGWAELLASALAIVVTAIVMGIKGVDATIKWFMATNPVGWILAAIAVVVSAVKGLFDLIEAFNPPYERLKDAAKESVDAWKGAEDELDSLQEKLEQINEQIDKLESKKGKLSLADEKELEYLTKKRDELEAIRIEQEKETKKAKEKAANDAATALDKYNNTKTTEGSKWWQWLLTPWWGAGQEIASAFSDTQEEKFDKILQNYKGATEEDKDFISNTLKEYEKILGDFEFGDSPELDKYLHQYFSLIDRYNVQTGDAAVTWKRVLSDSRFTSEVEKLQELADNQGVSMDAISSAASKFLDYLKEIGLYTDGNVDSANALVESIKELRKRLETKTKISFTDDLDIMQDKYDSLNNALNDIDKNGVISMDNISKIIDKDAEGYPELLQKYFNYVEGVGYKLADEWKGKSRAEILTAMAQDELKKYANEVSNAQEILKGMSSDNEDYETAVENLATAQENLNIKTSQWTTILREQALKDESERLKSLQEMLEKQGDKYKELIDIRKDLLQTYKEELDYQKELAKKQKAVADLQTQLALASLDNSASGQAKVRELQNELNDAQNELDEYTLERAIDKLTIQLDEDYDAYQEFIQTEVDRIVETIDNLASTFKVKVEPNEGKGTPIESHHSGGFVGNLVTLKSNEEFAKLLKGEHVSTPKQMDRFMRKTLPSMGAYGSSAGATINNNSPLIEINCGAVDENALPKLKAVVDQAVLKITKNMESALNRTGYKKKF